MNANEIVTPYHVENEILRLSGMLEHQTTETAHRAQDDAEADGAYDLAYAKALLQIRSDSAKLAKMPPIAIQEAEALVECEEQLKAKLRAAARYRAALEAGRNYRAQLDALRSINANVRHAAGLS